MTHHNDAGQETYKLTHDALLSTIGAAGTEFYVEIEEGSGQVLAIQGISSVESGTEPLGIGIVSDEDGIATISKCVEGGAGHRMGLREDDEVIEINGRPMMGQEHDYVRHYPLFFSSSFSSSFSSFSFFG